MGGAAGLDYNVVLKVFDLYGIDDDEQWWYLEGIRIFEAELLKSLEKKREKEARNQEVANQNIPSKTCSGAVR